MLVLKLFEAYLKLNVLSNIAGSYYIIMLSIYWNHIGLSKLSKTRVAVSTPHLSLSLSEANGIIGTHTHSDNFTNHNGLTGNP